MKSQRNAIGFDRNDPDWWKSAVFYQIYPRSFADANGDGIGDLAGITERIPYIASLGVDALWISPIFTSPMHDFGYDVADYCDIDPTFGTLTDADELIARCHEYGLRVTLDWVPNHTSNEHPWFAESRSSRDSDKRDWYVWRDPAPDGGPPNNWRAAFGDMPAWTFDAETGQYYLHLFLPEQPDLNWHHRPVRDAMHETLKFWLDRGVDGFRADVVHLIGKNPALPDHPRGPRSPITRIDDPATHGFLREIRSLLDSYDHHPMMIGEVNLYRPGQVASYLGDSDELHLAFDFRAMSATWDADSMRATMDAIHSDAASGTQPTWVLSNHDQPRHRTRYGSDERARAAAFLSLAQRSTPYLYAGEEFGLGDATIPAEAVVDPGGRDGCRAPIPWSDDAPHSWGPNPWLPFVADAAARSFATQDLDPDSILALYRRLLERRAANSVLRNGEQQTLDLCETVVAWSRTSDGRRIDIAINMGPQPIEVDLQGRIIEGSMRQGVEFDGTLAPDEAVMIEPR